MTSSMRSSGSVASNSPSALVRPSAIVFFAKTTRMSQSAAGSPVNRLAANNTIWPGDVLVTRPTSDTITMV